MLIERILNGRFFFPPARPTAALFTSPRADLGRLSVSLPGQESAGQAAERMNQNVEML